MEKFDGRLEYALGTQIRAIRLRIGLSLVELAYKAHISSGMLSKIEYGRVSPSLSTLQALANAMETPFASLFKTYEERHDCCKTRNGKGVTVPRPGLQPGHDCRDLGASLVGDIEIETYQITLSAEAEPYVGIRQSGLEFIYMLKGDFSYRVGEQIISMKPGDAILFDADRLHGPENLSQTPVVFLSVVVPPIRRRRRIQRSGPSKVHPSKP